MSDNVISIYKYMKRDMGQCPACRRFKVMPIIYGLPDPAIQGDECDDIGLGGCIVSNNSPNWHCRECGHRF